MNTLIIICEIFKRPTEFPLPFSGFYFAPDFYRALQLFQIIEAPVTLRRMILGSAYVRSWIDEQTSSVQMLLPFRRFSNRIGRTSWKVWTGKSLETAGKHCEHFKWTLCSLNRLRKHYARQKITISLLKTLRKAVILSNTFTLDCTVCQLSEPEFVVRFDDFSRKVANLKRSEPPFSNCEGVTAGRAVASRYTRTHHCMSNRQQSHRVVPCKVPSCSV